ncbi:hypothetical protein [Chitinophaga tropicalis]|uniref:Uncharacterized protein n=1 Tax=Chitinophaga tropicalis TaxID=2683588 RepID=A0A7K1UDS0_9BACT|nr:hypothetical protein [Chitinophaga tropicalis]MVT12522.1 hypothetical protein [Chitinophaga tropicalis]
MAQPKKAQQDKAMLDSLLQTTLTTAKEVEAPVQMVVPVKTQPPAEKLKQIIIRIPANQKKTWERYCLDKDVFMQEMIIDAVEAKMKQ